ncbi:MAG: hypothetical protein EAZ89_10135 [Bacteroidetes bacterium]|nr:MAG: hypothetical protein EAZ89_10135 [Bacteroidota bacterium]
MRIVVPFCIFLLLFAASCTSSETQEKTGADTLAADTLVITGPDLSVKAAPTVLPELVGKWQLVEIQSGESTPMGMDLTGNSAWEFTADGNLIISAPDLGSQSYPFTYENGVIRSEGTPDDQLVTELTPNRLVLSYTIDNTEIRNVFKRQP